MIRAAMTRPKPLLAFLAVCATGALVACGSEGISPKVLSDSPNIVAGAKLFATRCAGCHTLDYAGTQGSATKVRDRERTDGPNLNVRKEDVQSVLYAIRNGGFSGAIMPENIVVGRDAQDVAAFISKYAGRQSHPPPAPSAP
jgi:mono/diheme cytochrome c family protein